MLPSDASADQSNCPEGYYRRSNGMLHQLPGDSEVDSTIKCPHCHATALTYEEVHTLASLPQTALESALMRSYAASGLVMLATMSKAAQAQAMMDTLAQTALMPIVAGLNMKADIDSRLKAIDRWLDREQGKAVQRVEQKIEHSAKGASSELTNEQLIEALRSAQAQGLLPGGAKMLDDGTVVIDAEWEEVKAGS